MLEFYTPPRIEYDGAMRQEFSRDVVAHVARLARLRLTPEEMDRFAGQLGRVLAYAEQIQEVDTAGVPPGGHVLAPEQAPREDEVRPGLSRDDALANAPDADRSAGLFKVPRVLG
jgi:aspartyl-tRNA(Asn)/glutamyl-tRNA(Gln) amidotransferase subunit C